jgi:hypothetical protein
MAHIDPNPPDVDAPGLYFLVSQSTHAALTCRHLTQGEPDLPRAHIRGSADVAVAALAGARRPGSDTALYGISATLLR